MSDPTADLVPLAFADLPGWRETLLAPTFRAFRRAAPHRLASPPRTEALGVDASALLDAARAALALPEDADEATARAFFETRFAPLRVAPHGDAPFLTGYFEPELAGTRRPDDPRFPVPLLARPADLVDVDDATRPATMAPTYAFARATPDGLVPFFDRGEIEDGALVGRGLELVFLGEPVDAFFVHVQGSVRVRLVEGGVVRLAYAAKAGHPYTSIGRLAIERGLIAAEAMTLDALRDWLKSHPVEARALMRENRSYVFFAEQTGLDDALGAVAASGVQLTPGVSLAVDRRLHTFGVPIFLDADLPLGTAGASVPFRRLMLADDTGSAIVGPARGDVFVGLGDEAGEIAGRIRHGPRAFVVLAPKGEGTA
ncbi:MAG: MltA domain-containing protein [Hyphomicrobiales bacterium]|nr:MltA domain-containing protein [Hyphomicrobiales bacterium]